MLSLIEANHGQSIERRVVISRPVETTDLDKYANKMFKSDCVIDLEVGKLITPLLAVISEKMFASYVFSDKNQKPLRMSRMQITNGGGHFVTNFWYMIYQASIQAFLFHNFTG